MVSTEDTAKNNNFGDATDDDKALLHRQCFALQSPEPVDDW